MDLESRENAQHKHRLTMMSQERTENAGKKPKLFKNFKVKELFTVPQISKYVIPTVVVLSASLLVIPHLSKSKNQEKLATQMISGYGKREFKGRTLEDMASNANSNVFLNNNKRNVRTHMDYTALHMDRVMAGEDPFEVARELQMEYKTRQTLKRDNPYISEKDRKQILEDSEGYTIKEDVLHGYKKPQN